jgi:hypothetical protein
MGGIGRRSWGGGGLWVRFKLFFGVEFVFRVGVEIGYMLGKAFPIYTLGFALYASNVTMLMTTLNSLSTFFT